MEEDKKNMVENTLKSVIAASDSSVVIGEPFVTPGGATIIPVTKSVTAVMTGGGEYGEIGIFSGNKKYPSTNGGGGIVSVKPYGFIVERNKKIEYISCPENTYEKLFDGILGMMNDEKI